ncbi:signal transduction histidine kinase/ligand-binding sensor domain-containing protein/CheY-like chemotaxis protein/AraC-like DNA-binding protein [Parabacteroides sp. PM6-13]|uniref:two-component regulator propeller domain-containing protein n=1 Tax=Parabacteroides sp. PM6-13 TaxID=1742408 RepID=UPI002475D55E|nr:two-component regulator propeller domain-containing protein [Parabacteroides sp. PM6-13]MDH6343096.1 signal transduction histidine kinase/ligand-binding sensor domain-containing protein/CheY-like chemotaxis protein/AraC-like DNA-binding protein [Parabacteroides sp. PM6-13]
MRYLYTLLFLFVCSVSLYAQAVTPYRVREFETEKLTSHLINKIVQDQYGFIWIATDYGLNKFDGIHFTPYLHNDEEENSLLSDNVRCLLIDKKGTLLVGSSQGLQYYDPDEDAFKTIAFPGDKSLHISRIMELHTGEIWVTTSGGGIFSIDPDTYAVQYKDQITEITGLHPGYIYEDRQHFLWVETELGDLLRIDPVTHHSLHLDHADISKKNITGMLEDQDGVFYLSTSASVYVFDREKQNFISLNIRSEHEVVITNIFLNSQGTIYVTTDGQGLMYIDTRSGSVLPIIDNRYNSFIYTTARIPAIAEDRDQNIWLGCFQEGIFMLHNSPTGFEFWEVPDKEDLRGKKVTVVSEDHEGNIWYAINREGLFQLNDRGEVIAAYKDYTKIMAIYTDSQNTLWVSSYTEGLGKFNTHTGKIDFLHIPFDGYYMKTIAEGSDQQLYISSFGQGFIRYDMQTHQWEKYDMRQSDTGRGRLTNNWINCILSDSDNLIWLGHYKGLSCFDPQHNRFIDFKQKDNLSEQVCLSLIEDEQGWIWIGTYNGVFCFNKQTGEYAQYTTENGLSSNVICGLAHDEEGNIWCSTFNGINQLQRKDNQIINYYTGNGLMDKRYIRGVYFQGNNRIYFGGDNGITSFAPMDIENPRYQNKTLITDVYIHNKPINRKTVSGNKPVISTSLLEAEEFRFSYEDNTFAFAFSTMDFLDSENIYYLYRLKELSDEWISTLPGVGQIAYNHLNPGKYTLEIKASKYGVHSPVKQVSIIISPPWYRSPLAWFIYLVFFISLSLLVANLIRKKRKEQINESKLQFFINISHEIRSPLTLVISPMEKLLKEDMDPATQKILQGMYRNANRILDLVNQLLDIRKIDKGQMKLQYTKTDMVRFIDEIYKVFEYQANKRGIHFVFEYQTNDLTAWIDRSNFDKVLMNLLSNAFKYTLDGGEIIITLDTGVDKTNRGALHHYMEIKITDSGIGLEKEKIDKLFDRFYQGENQKVYMNLGSGIGLNLTKNLVNLHHGTITAHNREETSGSCFVIRIPLGKKHIKKENLTEELEHPYMPKQTLPIRKEKEREKLPKRKTNYKVLIVDDEEEIREYLVQELRDFYHTLTAVDGQEGLQIALLQQPDLIISDVMMPNLDGINLVKKLKSNSNTSHIPVLLLTSKTEFKDRLDGLKKGADAYLTKPFLIEELLTTITNLLKNRQLLKGKFLEMQNQKDKIKPPALKSNDEKLMERIIHVINDELGNPDLNVELLASRVGLSRSQLHRRMKELTGISTIDFIRNIRLKQAAILLKEKRIDVSQVAYAVGISNQAYFSTMFKRFYGVSPTEYSSQEMEDI